MLKVLKSINELRLVKQILALEERINQLERDQVYSNGAIGRVEAREQKVKDLINVSDFSPMWGFTRGGEKILICLEKAVEEVSVQSSIIVTFGNADVAAEMISPSVIRCTSMCTFLFVKRYE